MVGKIKHVRQKLHQQAVQLQRDAAELRRPGSLALSPAAALLGAPLSLGKEQKSQKEENEENVVIEPSTQLKAPPSLLSGIFAGTKIAPEVLVQSLKFEEPPDVSTAAKEGTEEKKVKSKKEKMKERRDRWLSKITSIKQAKEQQAAAARRQATPVVGDMKVLADALPELSQLLTPPTPATTSAARRRNRKNKVPVKKSEPTDFSLMKQSQKRKLMETETSRFGEAVKILAAKANPLADIGEQLRKRMRQEEEQGAAV
ncbi:ribosome biogenesis protein SLX9 homolog [Genypterus blacodes]|uniref:ribosome biogenesis protein SLX9 homolog n=1 Tax=Genypterus blacodes TaxID=154954 RepID=UPI003F765C82